MQCNCMTFATKLSAKLSNARSIFIRHQKKNASAKPYNFNECILQQVETEKWQSLFLEFLKKKRDEINEKNVGITTNWQVN